MVNFNHFFIQPAHGHAFYRMMNMRAEYLIHKTHRTFRAWLLPFALLADNLDTISCIARRSNAKRFWVLIIMHIASPLKLNSTCITKSAFPD